MIPLLLVLALAALVTSSSGCTCDDCGSQAGAGESIIPPETADEAALALLSDWQALPVFGTGTYRQQSSEDRQTGAPAPFWLLENGNRDMNSFVCASSNAERGEEYRVPLIFDQASCAESYVRGFVMARFEGSGRLARIWLTAQSLRKEPADREVLRIYVDDKPTPLVQAPLRAVLDGSAGEIFAPPFGAGSFRFLAWYYPVVFQSKLIVAIDRLGANDLYYHQTDVVLDPAPTERRAATERLAARDRALRLLRPGVPITGEPHAKRLALGPGQSAITHTLSGPATIQRVRLRVAIDLLYALEDVELRVVWDGAERPALQLPLSYLFAAADAIVEEPSAALGASVEGDQVELSLQLPMPFETRAAWAVANQGREQVAFELVLDVAAQVPTQPWGRLHVQHFDTTEPDGRYHPLVSATGRGRLVGVCLMMQGRAVPRPDRRGHPLNFLEGDERGVIDGQLAIGGTGTEDYLNGAFYFEDGVRGNPFAQVWGIVPNDRGRAGASACRWHVLGDAIDFASSLELEMEIGPGLPACLERYRTVAFLYQ